jgi:hypothetical protein
MHPFTSYQLALARVADLRNEAQRDTLARTARRRPARGTTRPKSPSAPHMRPCHVSPGGLAGLRTEGATQ